MKEEEGLKKDGKANSVPEKMNNNYINFIVKYWLLVFYVFVGSFVFIFFE